MREGWTYKKLGDYIKEYSVKNKAGKDIPVYSVTNSQGFCKEYFSKEVASQDKTSYKIVPYGFFAFNPSRINVGSIDWQHKEEQVIVSPLYNVFSVSESVLQPYLLYYLKSPATIKYIDAIATGTVRLNLKLSMLKDFSIPLPSLSEQQAIVSELDKINELISLKKAQLNDLDSLAQSIFYDMFGDPIENEKGWEVKKLGEACLLKAGKSIKASDLVEKKDNTFPCYGGNGIRGYIDRFSHEMDLPIIGRQGALCGNVNFAKGPFYATEHAVVVTPIVNLDVVWLYYVLKGLRLENYAHGVAQPGISVGDLNPIPLPIPPLSLQQDFAKRIELIEQQKTQISSTIKDLETLLASRMQYWFD